MKNIEGKNIYIFWTTWGISMKLSGKIPKKQGSTLSLENMLLEKPQGGVKLTFPPVFIKVLTNTISISQQEGC